MNVEVSMLLLTRAPEGILFYMGSRPMADPTLETFVAMELKLGQLKGTIKLGQTAQSFIGGPRVDDGRKHLIKFVRNEKIIQAFVDEKKAFEATLNQPFVYPLLVEVFYIGGLPGAITGRQKRQAKAFEAPKTLKSALQDFR